MASIFKNPTHKAQNGYNGFDMSNLLKFSSTVGELLPVYYDILQPDDKVKCRTELRTRTMELASAAMCSITEHLEWFFVPMEQLYKAFGSWYFNVEDLDSSFFSNYVLGGDTKLPYFTPATMLDCFYAHATTDLADSIFPQNYGSRYRLLEYLDIPIEGYMEQRSGDNVVGWCPILAQAYQKIYHDYFRDTEREEMLPTYWNTDIDCMVPASLDYQRFLMFTTLRYRSWKPDFYTNIFPSPLFGSSSVNALGRDVNDVFQQWLTATNFGTYSSGSWTSDSTNNFAPNPLGRGEMSPDSQLPTQLAPNGLAFSSSNQTSFFSQPGNIQQALSPTSIRTSFAVQKLLEVTRRAGKTYDAQQMAHFGVKLNRGLSGRCAKLGETTSVINIGDVISTAAGSTGESGATSVLGQVGGKGYGYGNSDTVNFTAPCHGILMCIYSAEPEVDYAGYSMDKLNTLMSRSDWFTPEFDNLGMQPLFNYQSQMSVISDSGWTPFGYLGWQYRYSELKCKYNKVRGALRRDLYYWSTARAYMSNALYSFKINPAFLNNIMLTAYSGLTVEDISNNKFFGKDPLIHELYFEVKKASRMSTYGLEQL